MIAEIGTVERGVFVDFSCEEALAQRAVRNKADPKFLECRQHFFLWVAIPQRVFALESGDWLDCVGATNRLWAGFRKAEMLHLAFPDQILHRSRYIFDGDVGVNAVLIEQVDDIGLKPLERGFGYLPDVLWPAVQPSQTSLRLGIDFPSELRGDHHLAPKRSKGFAYKLFVCVRTIDLGRVEERDAAFDGRADQRDHFLLVFGRAVGKAHSHAAEADGRDFQIAFSQFALLHLFLLRFP